MAGKATTVSRRPAALGFTRFDDFRANWEPPSCGKRPTTAPGPGGDLRNRSAAAARRRRACANDGTRRALVLVEAVAPATADEWASRSREAPRVEDRGA